MWKYLISKKNKMIFSKLINQNYKIIKDNNDKDILYIQSNDTEIKCKCILFLIEKPLDNQNNSLIICTQCMFLSYAVLNILSIIYQ